MYEIWWNVIGTFQLEQNVKKNVLYDHNKGMNLFRFIH